MTADPRPQRVTDRELATLLDVWQNTDTQFTYLIRDLADARAELYALKAEQESRAEHEGGAPAIAGLPAGESPQTS